MGYISDDGVHSYRTSDGSVFNTEMDAEFHQRILNDRSGGSSSSSSGRQEQAKYDAARIGARSGEARKIVDLYNDGKWQELANFRADMVYESSQHLPWMMIALAHARVGNYLKALEKAYYGGNISHFTEPPEVKELQTIAFQEAVQQWENANGRTMNRADLVSLFENELFKSIEHVISIGGCYDEIIDFDRKNWEKITGKRFTSTDEKRIFKGGKGLFVKTVEQQYPDLAQIPARSILPALSAPAPQKPQSSSSSTSSSWDLCCQGMTAYNAKNYSKAVELWRKAEEMGDTLAVHKDFYSFSLNDQGIAAYNAKDYAKAVELWKKAADMGNTYAMRNVGVCYEKGQGVAQDYNKAEEWYKKAIAAGDEKGKTMLATLNKMRGK